MRSIFVFTNAPMDEVGAVLGRVVGEQYQDRWCADNLWAHVVDPPDWAEWEHVDRHEIAMACDGEPARIVVAEISGRIDGAVEARDLALSFLALGPGAVFDDWLQHLWEHSALVEAVDASGRRLLHGDP